MRDLHSLPQCPLAFATSRLPQSSRRHGCRFCGREATSSDCTPDSDYAPELRRQHYAVHQAVVVVVTDAAIHAVAPRLRYWAGQMARKCLQQYLNIDADTAFPWRWRRHGCHDHSPGVGDVTAATIHAVAPWLRARVVHCSNCNSVHIIHNDNSALTPALTGSSESFVRVFLSATVLVLLNVVQRAFIPTGVLPRAPRSTALLKAAGDEQFRK